jgi:hypothetical protein
MLIGSGCGSHSLHHITFATAIPLGVLFAPTNMVINVDIVVAWSLQTNLPQKAHEARGSSSQCQHFIIKLLFCGEDKIYHAN